MRIVHVIDSMEVGGAEVIVATLCRIHRQMGHDPSVVCLYATGALGEQLRSEGISVECIGQMSTPALIWRLFQRLRLLNPDVVHCHNAMATIAGAWVGKLRGATVISTRHGLVAPPHKIRREIKFSITGRACDWVVGVCDATVKNLRSLPFARGLRMTRIYSGAPIAGPSGERQKNDLFTLVSVGRLVALKDFETSLRAFAAAHSRLTATRLIIVGDGPQAPILKSLANELGVAADVLFTGETTDIWQHLQVADAFLMSSRSEGLPIALLEAMAGGLPAIVTDVGGMSEVIRLTDSGLIVPVGDHRAMAEAIVRLAQDRPLRQRMRAAATSAYQNCFTPEQMAERYLGLYRGHRESRKTE